MTNHIKHILHLADNALILGHRNSEWCGHGPVLEQDIALTNISLDLIGQARSFYQHAAVLLGDDYTEDKLAYFRDAHEFLNCLMVEQPNEEDWGLTVLRQFFVSNYQYHLYLQLQHHPDEQVAAICTKALKEVTYHLRWSSEWVIRLGDGTEESHARMTDALQQLSVYTKELITPAGYETGFINFTLLQEQWHQKTMTVLGEATLTMPVNEIQQSGGKSGEHSIHLTGILQEMQTLPRTHPEAIW